MATATQPRKPFSPKPLCVQDCESGSLECENDGTKWTPIITCPADFPPELFDTAISQLIYHPEYNSTLILRSETVSVFESDFPSEVPILKGFRALRTIHRKLLPRRPGRDAGLEQFCTLYGPTSPDREDDSLDPTVLVLTPIVRPDSELPYYHPRVSHLAFRYIRSEPAMLQIDVIPLPGTPINLDSRLYRTCLSLLDTLHRYGWGAMIHYKKRVVHDRIIPREEYQDLYLIMRERHKHLVDTWQEVTDPLKHVFEDIGIATFLMLLWKQMYATPEVNREAVSNGSFENEPWKQWPRPSTGFVDLGCGNGLLTHILTSEGYEGHGIDVRARTSWSHYSPTTQGHLHVEALEPTTLADPVFQHPYIVPGVFLIGNHADELTPWVPVLSTLISASGYLSIPCCPWTFDSRFERSRNAYFPLPTSPEEYSETLYLGGDGSHTSSYSQYRIWLASLSLHCGWQVECETLRIPSTRNWALIGRNHTWKTDEEAETFRQNVLDIIENVRERGIFKTRKPEGKAGDH